MSRRLSTMRGFTLIELLVAIAVSVVLLSILAFVFKISTAATRDASSRVSLTERLRTLNIRLRQEVGSMLPVQRIDAGGKPYADKRTFAIDPSGQWITFSTATQENGRPVSVDVRYEVVTDPTTNITELVRRRDKTGPYKQNPVTLAWTPNAKYLMGDDDPVNSWETLGRADVMVSNVLNCKFEATDYDIPQGMEGAVGGIPKATPSTTTLSPRELPAAIKLTISFRAEVGNPEMQQDTVMVFPIYRGL